MPADRLIEQQWVDIVLPAPPDDNSLFLFFAAGLFLLVVFGIFHFLHRNGARQRAVRKLRVLQRNCNTDAVKNREQAFRISENLRAGFQVARLDTVAMEEAGNARWHAYRVKLRDACYASHEPDREIIQWLHDGALYWLKQPVSGRGSTHL